MRAWVSQHPNNVDTYYKCKAYARVGVTIHPRQKIRVVHVKPMRAWVSRRGKWHCRVRLRKAYARVGVTSPLPLVKRCST